MTVLALSLGSACGERGDASAVVDKPTLDGGVGAISKPAVPASPTGTQAGGEAGAAASLDRLDDAGLVPDCPRGGPESVLHVQFHCAAVTTYTCKDLSNVVLEFGDGTRQRFEGLSGHQNTFAGTGVNAGKTVVRVWVKAGPNQSGDGPGYGERVDAPTQTCVPPGAGSGGGEPCVPRPDGTCAPIPAAGSGGSGEGCVPRPDGSCAPGGGVAGAGGAGKESSDQPG